MFSYPSSEDATQPVFTNNLWPREVWRKRGRHLLPILEATSVHLVLEGWLFPARQHLTQTRLQEADRLLVVTVALT